ncbi:protein phosphatase regulator BUD14 LALA0_S01e01310g [Lachancea lanzarotensis]|uniref:LALA0S01e01310g1_1 n=1 Tax=Lachancea lanzarotensis TaxID=1245769 RepID=A0A0C7MX65_9SACH|nr:uncharacterized protein LALA0_S01e01310g [Lachancea lanzarotensis]CEP60025.1 LALA0S01e01310g1_1 [Lachancea lanzarotensis]
MQNILDKAYDKYALTSSAPTNTHTDLLCDPDLVEDYKDIMRTMPKRLGHDEENNSVNGSVVINAASNSNSPEKDTKTDKKPVLFTSSSLTIDETRTEHKTTEVSKFDTDYEYSDSEFEEDMENRLQDLRSTAKQESNVALFADENNGDQQNAASSTTTSSSSKLSSSSSSSSEEEEEDDLTTAVTSIEPYRDPRDEGHDDEDDDDDEMDQDFQPLAPPEEIDPGKLYALYPFQGPDPSHCQLYQDQACVLLNDQDSYWWLVKRCDDGKIGFAPAEILETFPERLARLNCWKNENMSSQSVDSSNLKVFKVAENASGDEASPTPLLPYSKNSKSVSFNDVVSYAERLSRESGSDCSSSELDGLDDTDKEGSDRNKSVDTVGEIYEAALHAHDDDEEDDDASVAVSDVSFNTGSALPLNVKKVRKPSPELESGEVKTLKLQATDTQELDTHLSPLASGSKAAAPPAALDDGLQQTFKAPIIPFAGHKEMPNSNSNYSISTIGDYSPSSSEWTNDSPQVNNGTFDTGAIAVESIPSSRAIKDISKLVNLDKPDSNFMDPTKGFERMEESSQQKPEDKATDPLPQNEAAPHHDGQSKSGSFTIPGTSGDYSLTSRTTHRESTSASSDDSCIDEGRGTSTTTINSTFSLSEAKYQYGHHPIVHELYNPLFGKIDDLLDKLNSVMHE